jgi:hypothetical protein
MAMTGTPAITGPTASSASSRRTCRSSDAPGGVTSLDEEDEFEEEDDFSFMFMNQNGTWDD